MMIGLAVSALGLLAMSRFDLDVDFRSAVLARVVQSLGLAFLFVPVNATAFYFVAKQSTSYATGLINLARNMGGSTGIALATTLIARREQFHQQRLLDHVSTLDGAYGSTFQALQQMFLAKGADAVYAASQARQMIYDMVQRQSSMLSFIEVFRMLAFAFLAMLPLLFLLKRTRPKKVELGAE
jgi:DHA2 family multidrug resistance protein